MAEKLSIVFLGSGPVAAASLDTLADVFTIEAVITKHKPAHHRGEAPVEVIAARRGLTTVFASNRAQLDECFTEHAFTSRLGVVVDYGVIISGAVIASFPLGIVNSHFSLLPEWRGADPITFSLLSGQPKTGVSVMVIDEGLDTGKLITQKTIAIAPDDTVTTLTDKLVDLSNTLLTEWLPKYADGDVTPHNQPHPDRATHSRKLKKDESILDFTKPAEILEREIRAFAGWPKSRTTIAGLDVVITKAHVDAAATNPVNEPIPAPGTILADNHSLAVATSQGLLHIDMIQPAGKKEMPVTAFLAGYGSRLSS